MGHATAADLKVKVDECLVKLQKCNLVQLSMDGPSINWKLFENLQVDIEQDTGKKILNGGSCCLHTVHGAFQDYVTASGWGTDCFLSSAYYLFKHTPARREDFTTLTLSKRSEKSLQG